MDSGPRGSSDRHPRASPVLPPTARDNISDASSCAGWYETGPEVVIESPSFLSRHALNNSGPCVPAALLASDGSGTHPLDALDDDPLTIAAKLEGFANVNDTVNTQVYLHMAAACIRDCLLGEHFDFLEEKVQLYQWYRSARVSRLLSSTVLLNLSLSMFHSLRRGEGVDRTVLDPLLGILEVWCVLVFVMQSVAQYGFMGPRRFFSERLCVGHAFCTLLYVFDIFFMPVIWGKVPLEESVYNSNLFTLRLWLRPLFTLIHFRNMRDTIMNIIRTGRALVPVVMFLCIFFVLFAIYGFMLFRDNNTYFKSVPWALYQLLIGLTTANFPDLMMQSYAKPWQVSSTVTGPLLMADNKTYYTKQEWYVVNNNTTPFDFTWVAIERHAAPIYFVLFYLIGMYFLLAIVFAVVYRSYRRHLQQQVLHYYDFRQCMLMKAYRYLLLHIDEGYDEFHRRLDILHADVRGLLDVGGEPLRRVQSKSTAAGSSVGSAAASVHVNGPQRAEQLSTKSLNKKVWGRDAIGTDHRSSGAATPLTKTGGARSPLFEAARRVTRGGRGPTGRRRSSASLGDGQDAPPAAALPCSSYSRHGSKGSRASGVQWADQAAAGENAGSESPPPGEPADPIPEEAAAEQTPQFRPLHNTSTITADTGGEARVTRYSSALRSTSSQGKDRGCRKRAPSGLRVSVHFADEERLNTCSDLLANEEPDAVGEPPLIVPITSPVCSNLSLGAAEHDPHAPQDRRAAGSGAGTPQNSQGRELPPEVMHRAETVGADAELLTEMLHTFREQALSRKQRAEGERATGVFGFLESLSRRRRSTDHDPPSGSPDGSLGVGMSRRHSKALAYPGVDLYIFTLLYNELYPPKKNEAEQEPKIAPGSRVRFNQTIIADGQVVARGQYGVVDAVSEAAFRHGLAGATVRSGGVTLHVRRSQIKVIDGGLTREKLIRALFYALDQDGSRALDQRQFRALYQLLQLKVTVVRDARTWAESGSHLWDYAAFRGLVRFGRSTALQRIIDACIIGSAAFMTFHFQYMQIKHIKPRSDDDLSDRWFTLMYCELAVGLVFDVEVALKLVAYGWHEYWNKKWNRFDFVITAMNTAIYLAFLILLFIYGARHAVYMVAWVHTSEINNTDKTPDLIMIVLLGRLLRCLRVASSSHQPFRYIMKTFVNITPVLCWYMLAVVMVFFAFATLGMHLFGHLTPPPSTVYSQLGYYPLNFSSFYSSFVTLWCLMVVNNWFVIVDAYRAAASDWVLIYFVSFFLVTVILLMNIIMAFIVELWDAQWTLNKKKDLNVTNHPLAQRIHSLNDLQEGVDGRRFYELGLFPAPGEASRPMWRVSYANYSHKVQLAMEKALLNQGGVRHILQGGEEDAHLVTRQMATSPRGRNRGAQPTFASA